MAPASEFPSFESHFDGTRFHNVPDRPPAGLWTILKWVFTRSPGEWDEPSEDFEPGEAPPERVDGGAARVTFVNHATVLIQIDGLNLLTDPMYSRRASPLSWLGPVRVRPPGIQFDDLPPIDAVLLSHNHYDHLCRKTLGRIQERDQPLVYTGLGNERVLRKTGVRSVAEMDWWDTHMLSDRLALSFVPAQHFSARHVFDRCKTLWGGFYLTLGERRIYFAGDSGDGRHFEAIRERLGAPDLAIIPIGAFLPPEIMKSVHVSPEEAVEVHRRLGARQSMAIHFGTFQLADDGQREPVEALERALESTGLTGEDFWVPAFGEGRQVF